jgi:hypothetical protein
MKTLFPVLVIFLFNLNSYGQFSQCDSLINEHCEGIPCIKDTNAFCRGVEKALAYNGLAVQSVGDPGHMWPCDYLAYKMYGVQLILTGDIVLPGQFEENAGFNAIMEPRLKDSLGTNYEHLGKLDSTWQYLSMEKIAESISNLFIYENLSDSTVKIILNPSTEKNSIFENMKGVKFADYRKVWVDRNALYEGVTFRRYKNNRLYLTIDFEDYPNENHICEASGKFTLPINFE